MLRVHAIRVCLRVEQGVQAQEDENDSNGKPQFAAEGARGAFALDEVAPKKQLDIAEECHGRCASSGGAEIVDL
jgi:hypothetical protein